MKKKSVGIITIQKSPVSYGANLQAYALYRYVNSLGFDCEIIDLYRPSLVGYVDASDNLHFHVIKQLPANQNIIKYVIKFVFHFIRRFINRNNVKLKKNNFNRFINMLEYSRPYKSVDELYNDPPCYDFYITGSDQVWNPDIRKELEPYFLTFTKETDIRISYASSFGCNDIPQEYKADIARCLSRYNLLSVRESNAQLLIEQLIGLRPEITLDPTFLLDRNHWESLAIKPDIGKPYVVCFTLHDQTSIVEMALRIAKEQNKKLVLLNKHASFSANDYYNASSAGPMEWLGIIQHADFVITDSFHGTVFSIIFQKPFVSLVLSAKTQSSLESRIFTLLMHLELRDRVVAATDVDIVTNLLLKPINYSHLTPLLNKLIDSSKQFLKRSLDYSYD